MRVEWSESPSQGVTYIIILHEDLVIKTSNQ